ncbi:unnamed protein product [Staurois parvus]|uniref:Uncharacterized protein n=1 Tax=Staurois parvus TaxID=386267 RepID=A0ABN9DNE8_9NEOB|nr:unnamed protein product [Staurois parvus]
MRGSGSTQRGDRRCAVSATCQCPSVPRASAHQCHISVPTSAHNATYKCPSELTFSVAHQCQSVSPISAAYQCA